MIAFGKLFFNKIGGKLTKSKVIFESNEKVYGYLPRDKEWVCYQCILTVKNSNRSQVTLTMTFVPPHPPWFKLPEGKIIRGESISDVYGKVSMFFKKFGIDFK
jgi:hypothetical protein